MLLTPDCIKGVRYKNDERSSPSGGFGSLKCGLEMGRAGAERI